MSFDIPASHCRPTAAQLPGVRPPVVPGMLHRAVVAVDVIGFGRRVPALHPHLRAALYHVTETAFASVGLPLHLCDHEDRGDGILVIAPPDAGIEALLCHLPAHLHAALRHHNQMSARAARLRLRLAVNAGYVHLDRHGAGGRALVHLHRLLDAPAFKTILDDHHADLGLITSDDLYQEIVCGGPGLIDPAAFLQIDVAVKETRARAWMWMPDLAPAWPRLTWSPDTTPLPHHGEPPGHPRAHGRDRLN
ncbi:hypothetical protein ABZ801_19445 [Actinomadura sp. NPDC047616]|uniref:hypothetical protein n=1 Tax=Actinomadura sp. NPDC047616 TaxID=3155914 RepID=UPI003400A0F0